MSFQVKIIGLVLLVPLLVGVQGGGSCRRATPKNTSNSNVNINVNNNQNVNSEVREKLMPQGTWGGNHISLVVGADGAEVEYDCAHGSIKSPLAVDSEGRFDLLGTHTIERPGPVREGQDPPSRPVRFQGRIEGKQMTLKVTFTDTGEEAGEFTLTQGGAGRLHKCL